jgi:hypothetical protein
MVKSTLQSDCAQKAALAGLNELELAMTTLPHWQH